MLIKRIIVGALRTNCYLLIDENSKEAVIIDPGGEPEKIQSLIKKEKLKPLFILLTHSHPDHNAGVEYLEKSFKINHLNLKEGEEVKVGKNLTIKAIKTPGHTSDSFCFIVAKNIFSGDTLFKQGFGRTDLPGGDFFQLQHSLARLMKFPDSFKVLPGHGPETTIGEERKFLNLIFKKLD